MNFQHFSTLHIGIIFAGIGMFFATARYARGADISHYRRDVNVGTWLMFGIYVLLTATKIIQKEWTIQGNLPLHLCDISAWTLVYALYRKNDTAFEAGYFWGLTGALLAFVVPTVTKVDWYLFPFFVWHALLAAMPIYYIIRNQKYPTQRGLWRTVGLTIILGISVKGINHLIGFFSGNAANYMFVNERIDAMRLLGLPEYPIYLFYLTPIMIGLFYVFLFVGYKRQ